MKTRMSGKCRVGSKEMLERKLVRLEELAEQIAEGGVLKPGSYPSSMTEFRNWVDEDVGLEKIGSPRMTNKRLKPEHASTLDSINELILRLQAYESVQRNTKKKRPSLQNQLTKVTAELKDSKYQVARLLSQIQILLYELHTLRTASEDAEQARIRTGETVKSLASQVVQLGGTTVKRIK